MDVILLERVEKLGQIGDVVSVKSGFARNFLIPQKKALRANDHNKKIFENQRAEIEARNLEAKKEAEGVSGKLDGTSYVLIRQASDMGQLYGSVSSRDIADAASEGGVQVGRNQIVLDKPLKSLGVHPVRIVLHPEVSVNIEVNIARSQEEAEAQARGEDVLNQHDEVEEEQVAEAVEAVETEEFFEEGAEAPDAAAAEGEAADPADADSEEEKS